MAGLIWLSPILIAGIVWIWTAFGGLNEMFGYYNSINSDTYLGFRLYMPMYQYPLLLSFLGLICWKLYRKDFDYFKNNKLFWMGIVNLLLFYLFIKDTGGYSALIVPFYYLLITDMLQGISYKWINRLVMYGLVMVNALLLVFKSGVIISQWKARDYHTIDHIISDKIPENATVFADEIYIYSCLINKNKVEYIHLFTKERENNKSGIKSPQFLIISERLFTITPDILLDYPDYEAYYNFSVGNNAGNFKLPIIGSNISSGYSGTIFRKKERLQTEF